MKKDRDAYIVIAPTGKSKIYSVAARRIGSRERYSVIATCQNDLFAEGIVDGLNLLQREQVKIDTVAQRTLADVREQLIKERERANKISGERRDLQIKLGDEERKVRELERKLVLAVPQPSMTMTAE